MTRIQSIRRGRGENEQFGTDMKGCGSAKGVERPSESKVWKCAGTSGLYKPDPDCEFQQRPLSPSCGCTLGPSTFDSFKLA